MTTNTKSLHWTAIIGVVCSFWLLFWLFLIFLGLLDRQDGESDNKFLIVASLFTLVTAYWGKRRLTLLRYGEIRTATIFKRKEESYHYDSGVTNRFTRKYYRYDYQGKSFSTILLSSFWLGKIKKVPIVVNARNPDHSGLIEQLRAIYDPDRQQWLSPPRHLIPRLTLLILLAGGCLVLLLTDMFQ